MHYQPLDPATRTALQALYGDLDDAIARAGPVCQLSGRCCRFQEYDHRLYLSELEAAYLIHTATPPLRPLDAGATCPWQDSKGLCTAREARPLGCRVYYCDPHYHDEGPRLSELYIGQLKQLTHATGRPWNYAPLHAHLAAARATGQLAFPDTANPPSAIPDP
ncbi:MAG: hypothetical protein KatS3mg108_0589 [Isosphaeraceae bacterium]|jgi:hypothetical protein|nr:MAG: hypothetical protein KatS3mg108_0589 [Isosphaeraceae bacterium]